MAKDEHTKAYQWLYKYSLTTTKVLGKLACLVLLTILGIGTTKRNWKQVKAVKSGQRVNTGIEVSFDLCTVSTDSCTGADDQASCSWQVVGR